ncbi:ras-related protein Rap-1-like [Clavelina lepadiformis]|uniref:ras-related protein Rap-1-like n=1 Tax=Clavelina lepadiformis TaxID=159417 RepID=UPI00404143B2
MGKKFLPRLKIAIVGTSGVGKYSLSHQFANGWIAPRDSNEPGDNPSKIVQLDNGKYDLEVIVFRDLDDERLKDCQGVMVVYSVVDKASFQFLKTTALQKLFESLRSKSEDASNDPEGTRNDGQNPVKTPTRNPAPAGLSIPVVLVGNKVDEAELSREIEQDVGDALSRDLSCVGFFETAATCNVEVPKAFRCLLAEITKNLGVEKNKKQSFKKKCCIISRSALSGLPIRP